MKRIVCMLVLLLSMATTIYAQDYKSLWKQVEVAKAKDLPKTQIEWLDKIVVKARKEKNYGHILAAELYSAGLKIRINPDSLQAELTRIKASAQQAEHSDKVLAAVYYCAIGKIEQNKSMRSRKENNALAKKYFDKAMAYKDLLASHKLDTFVPLIKKGDDDEIFNNDLLHVIGFETEAYQELEQYYLAHNNRSAACYAAFKGLEKGSVIQLEKVDSLLDLYGDLSIAGELAKLKYANISDKTTDKELFTFVQNALKKYAEWKGIAYFKNVANNLQSSKIETNDIPEVTYSHPNGQYVKVRLRNVHNLQVKIIKTTLTGETDEPDTRASLRKFFASHLIPNSEIIINREYSTLRPAYEHFTDSIHLPTLSAGVYIISISSPSAKISAGDKLIYVSNLILLAEGQPNDKCRYVVVDAISGQPVVGAKIVVHSSSYGKQKKVLYTLTTNKQGEAICKVPKDTNLGYTYVSTSTDKGFNTVWVSPQYSYSKNKNSNYKYSIMTDRAIYRPGQTVHASIVVYSDSLEGLRRYAAANHKVTLSLRDANYREVAKKEVITDEYGTAATHFILPKTGLIGQFTVYTSGEIYNVATIRVEEYKRPTFEVIFDAYKEKYAPGDTITLHGHAKTYAGVGVQGAKVAYKVVRKKPIWWYWGDQSSDAPVVNEGNVMTDAKGDFKVKVPLLLAKDVMEQIARGKKVNADYYNFEVSATVTDQAGESRECEHSLPISTKSTAFLCDIPRQVVDTYPLSFKLHYLNAAGKEIESSAKYIIVPRGDKHQEPSYIGDYTKVKTNEKVKVKTLSSGVYRLHAICGEDTLDRDFVVFSLKDKRPVEETHDWFYVSGSSFPRDGSPVYVQVGSTDKDMHVIYSILAGDKMIEQGSFDQSNANTTRAFTYKPEYENGLTLNYVWVKNGKVYKHSVDIMRPIPDKALTLKWKTFRNKLNPGQKEEWILSVLRPDGKPANAQLVATLYDKSLDQIVNHSWHKLPEIRLTMPNIFWESSDYSTSYIEVESAAKGFDVKKINLAGFNQAYLSAFAEYSPQFFMEVTAFGLQKRKDKNMAESKVMGTNTRSVAKFSTPGIKNDADVKGLSEAEIAEEDTKGKTPVQLRENLNETAFFYPQLVTDMKGNVSMKFTLPECLTTWRFMGFAHDKEMNNGLLTDEAVASKTLMIQPNLPRFLRVGDNAIVSARIVNTAEKALQVKALLTLIDSATEQVVYTIEQQVGIEAGKTTSVSFGINDDVVRNFSKKALEDYSLLIARMTVEGDGSSDGEQQYLPVLSNKEYVVNTYPITMDGKSIEEIDLNKLFPKGALSNAKLTIEYTNNPAWLMIQALPYMAKANSEDAISLTTAYYANTLGMHIIKQSPKIKQTIELWKQELSDKTSLTSSLEKNKELKELVLNETPWVMNAEQESEQKQMLANFFDENTLQNNQQNYIAKLKKLQNSDGSFSWFPGMKGSLYMTVYIVKDLTRLQILMGQGSFVNDETASLMRSAFAYLDYEVSKKVKEMQRTEKKYHTTLFPSDDLCDYLYTNTLAKRATTPDITYLLDRLSKKPTDLTIYGKANAAVILGMYGKTKKANEYLKSIKEYTVATKEMGRYFDSRNAYYSWRNYKIPTEVAAIEALKTLSPNDSYIKEMQRWLLQEKRTQVWNTPINTVNAIWAFMNNGKWDIEEKVPSVFKLDGNVLKQPKATAGLGYVKVTTPIAPHHKSLSIEKQSEGTSFGGVYAQFFQKATDIKEASAGMTVVREMLDEYGNHLNGKALKIGDKVRIRLTITALRDLDFVQVVDKRAACLEPVNQLSGYSRGYYFTPKDNSTNYYFDMLTKGKHIVETEYYIDREGNYQSGTCTAQSAYAPEFSGRAAAIKLNINK